ncbi:probable Aurora kinase A at N-terminal half [Coccomyxa sp. Obi]|nr:probable Aurora kinase A at N-terminal half [Coccomyxa sp. Obi]
MSRVGAWRLEDFELQKQLYKGKASLLYKAICRLSGLPVALKLYRKQRLSALNWYQVQREIRIHSQLQHDNIVQMYAAFEDSDHVYLALQFAPGGDLYEELKRHGGQLSEERVARDVIQPCLSALAYLHRKGFLWRDCKPENILLGGPGLSAVKLADFGLSIDSTEERPVTRAGTLDYMAPEVVMCPEKSHPQENKEKALLGYTSSVDAWAIGILGYELIVGHPPFERETRTDTYEQIMYRRPNYPAWISEELRMFISAALTKSARKRPTVAELLNHPWILKHCPHAPAPAPAPELWQENATESPVAVVPDIAAKESPEKALSAPVFNIMVDCNVASGQGTNPAIQCSTPETAAESNPETGLHSIIQWANSSVQRLSSKFLGSAAVLQDPVSSAQPEEGMVRDSAQPDSSKAPSSRPRSGSFDEGSLATLFYPPLPEDHQKSSTEACVQPPAHSTALPIRGKLWAEKAASMDADDAAACSSPMAIKAHHGAHVEGVRESTTDTGVATSAARWHGALPLWESPVRRRPHGDSSGSLASTPPPRGPMKFPSYREGRLSVSRAGALVGGHVSSQS